MKPKDYKAIALWGAQFRSDQQYIESEQRMAARQSAPIDTLYWSHDAARWICVSDLPENHPFHQVYEQPK